MPAEAGVWPDAGGKVIGYVPGTSRIAERTMLGPPHKRAAYNRTKLARYDAFLTAWALAHPRYEQTGARPVVIFTSPSQQT